MDDLQVYHTNDMHGRDGALDWLTGAADSSALLLDVGDAIRGSNTAFRLHEPILDRMRELGFAAMAMGNREFHYTRAVLRRRRDNRGFPLLAANLEDRWHPDHDLWQPSCLLEHGGYRIGLLGATPVQYPAGAIWERLSGFRFLVPEQCLPPLVEQLRPRCDLVVLLSHLGFDRDRELAPRLSGVDVILGGHTHTVLEQPVVVSGVPILQTGSHSRYVGSLRLRPGRPVKYEYRLIPPDHVMQPALEAAS